MKHSVYGKKLGRDKNQRTALFRSLVRSLILHESIQTTETKAKAVKGLIDNLVVKAKDSSEASKRVVTSFLTQKEISEKLFKEIAPRFKQRSSGFTTSAKLGTRQGDGAMMVQIGWVGDKVSKEVAAKPTTKKVSDKTKTVKKVVKK